MKLDPLDAHDRYLYFKKQDFNISKMCQEIVDRRPFGNVPFYIFAHPRTDNEYRKRLIWQPRLTRPSAQTNSMLFRVHPGSDSVEIIWIIPPKEVWGQFERDKMMANSVIMQSIHAFCHDRASLESPSKGDVTDQEACRIYREIGEAARLKKNVVYSKV